MWLWLLTRSPTCFFFFFQALDYQANFSSGYYQALLTLIEKFFEGDVDQQSFEEISRYIFGSKAYVMFTIDKVVLALIRHVSDHRGSSTNGWLIALSPCYHRHMWLLLMKRHRRYWICLNKTMAWSMWMHKPWATTDFVWKSWRAKRKSYLTSHT